MNQEQIKQLFNGVSYRADQHEENEIVVNYNRVIEILSDDGGTKQLQEEVRIAKKYEDIYKKKLRAINKILEEDPYTFEIRSDIELVEKIKKFKMYEMTDDSGVVMAYKKGIKANRDYGKGYNKGYNQAIDNIVDRLDWKN